MEQPTGQLQTPSNRLQKQKHDAKGQQWVSCGFPDPNLSPSRRRLSVQHTAKLAGVLWLLRKLLHLTGMRVYIQLCETSLNKVRMAYVSEQLKSRMWTHIHRTEWHMNKYLRI